MVGGRFRLGMTTVAAAAAALSTGCTGSSTPTPAPTSTSPSPATSAPASVAQQLQQLAELGTKAVFHGTYLVRQRHPTSRATWQVWRTHSSLRVDVRTRHVTATLIRTPRATYSCRRSGHRKTCFRVAKANKPIPAPFRLLAERLFSDSLARLAGRPHSYTVSAPATGSVHVPTNGGACFKVLVPKNQSTNLATATYCLNPSGIFTAVVYPSGNVVRVDHVTTRAPSSDAFHPYSSPTPLPG
ncbi:MAG TPA: hypothetical protein VH274_03750 [Mycobacteriales bacterium]|nr:hypothetical protein [Mycobacteriales bacterium]